MTILMLNNDIFFNIFKDIKITKLNILELSNKNLNNKIKDYLEYIYKNDYKIIKAKFNIYDSNIYYLNTLLYKNINLFDKFIYYSDNIYFKKLIKKSFSIYNLHRRYHFDNQCLHRYLCLHKPILYDHE